MSFLTQLLGLGPKINFPGLMDRGAQIIDVRSPREFSNGHIKGSVNIPLQDLHSRIKKIRKDTPVITVCASGMRSAQAKGVLSAKGYEVYNGGGWASLEAKLTK
ncbi:MAG: rhodanese-like domain-containing protein [Bacteroidia bacterium]|nr:rhodanese-like domain-containing protein [Bacteroidia bacterium]